MFKAITDIFKQVQGGNSEPLSSEEKPFGFTGNALPDDYGRKEDGKGLGFIGFTGEQDQEELDKKKKVSNEFFKKGELLHVAAVLHEKHKGRNGNFLRFVPEEIEDD
jgi:hypothetical protein